jgi:uncharacterized protein
MTNPPHFKGFRPIGLPEENNPVVLNFEEYEAIRLSDFKFHGQVEAAQIMEVSRPTFSRIYESARRKVAQAFVQGKPIVFEGGKVYFDSEWYSCNTCSCWFNHIEKEKEATHCALCGSTQIEHYAENSNTNNTDDTCICPKCGFKKDLQPGLPYNQETCPVCNCWMVRKSVSHHNGMRYKNCQTT